MIAKSAWRTLPTLLPLCFSACVTPRAQTRLVEVEFGKGGVIAIPHQNDSLSRNEAMAVMAKNCEPKKAVVFKESEAVVGRHTLDTDPFYYTYRRNPHLWTMQSTVMDVVEWRLHYRCE